MFCLKISVAVQDFGSENSHIIQKLSIKSKNPISPVCRLEPLVAIALALL
jgi:hypothetical protein